MNAWSVATADPPAAAAPLATTAAGSSPRMLALMRATTWSKSRPYAALVSACDAWRAASPLRLILMDVPDVRSSTAERARVLDRYFRVVNGGSNPGVRAT